MAFRVLDQRPVYLNEDGVPCAFGTFATFETGTLTPKETFSDPGLTVSNGAIVNLEADGRTATDIWSSGVLRVQIRDANGILITDSDDTEATSEIPDQTDNGGKFLTTDGTALSWVAISQVPDVSGQAGKTLVTDGSTYYWGSPSVSGGTITNSVLTNVRWKVQTIDFDTAGDLAIDFTAGNYIVLNQSADIGTLSITGMTTGDGCVGLIRRIKDNNGTSRAIGFSSAFNWPGKTTPTWTQTAQAWDEIGFASNDGGTTIGTTVSLNMGHT